MKRTLVLLASLYLGLQSMGHAADCKDEVQTLTEGKLVVAAYDYPPFTFAETNGTIKGIDPSIIERFATDNCLQISTLVMDPAASIQAVVSGKADVSIGSWFRSANRTKVMGLSTPLYLDHMGIYSKEGYDTIEATIGKRVATVQGFFWVPDLQKVYGSSLKLYPTPVAMAQDLEAGRIDVGFVGYNAGKYNQAKNGAYKGIVIQMAKPDERVRATVLPPQTTMLYTKGNETLGKALDESIKTQQADGSMKKTITDAGFDPSITEVGEARLVQ